MTLEPLIWMIETSLPKGHEPFTPLRSSDTVNVERLLYLLFHPYIIMCIPLLPTPFPLHPFLPISFPFTPSPHPEANLPLPLLLLLPSRTTTCTTTRRRRWHRRRRPTSRSLLPSLAHHNICGLSLTSLLLSLINRQSRHSPPQLSQHLNQPADLGGFGGFVFEADA